MHMRACRLCTLTQNHKISSAVNYPSGTHRHAAVSISYKVIIMIRSKHRRRKHHTSPNQNVNCLLGRNIIYNRGQQSTTLGWSCSIVLTYAHSMQNPTRVTAIQQCPPGEVINAQRMLAGLSTGKGSRRTDYSCYNSVPDESYTKQLLGKVWNWTLWCTASLKESIILDYINTWLYFNVWSGLTYRTVQYSTGLGFLLSPVTHCYMSCDPLLQVMWPWYMSCDPLLQVMWPCCRPCDLAAGHVTLLQAMWPCCRSCDLAAGHVTLVQVMWPCCRPCSMYTLYVHTCWLYVL